MDHKVRIADIILENPNVKTYKLEKPERFTFLPGQFVNLYIKIDGVMEKRSYSISSSPFDDTIDLTIEKVQGGKVSPRIFDDADVGDSFLISNPMGKFTYDGQEKISLLAAGSGIAPMRSIIRYCEKKYADTQISVMYSVKTHDDVIFAEEFKDDERIMITTTRSDDGKVNGRIDAEKIKRYCDLDSVFYLCGSLEFVRGMAEIMKELDIPRERIKRDVWI